MAKVKLSAAFESLSGKLCSRNEACVQLNKKTGKMVLYDAHAGSQPNSSDQKAVRTTFTQVSKAIANWWRTNKPTTTNTTGSEDYQQLKKQFDSQNKVGNIYGYARTLVNKQGKLVIGSKTITIQSADGVTPGDSSNQEGL